MNLMQVDSVELKNLAESDPVANDILADLTSYRRNMPETKIDNLYYDLGKKYPWRRVMEAVRKLADLGAGTIILGRRGGKTRIEWAVPMIELGKAGAQALQPEQQAPDAAKKKTIIHTYKLRPDMDLMLPIPADLTQQEAKRLGEFVGTLFYN